MDFETQYQQYLVCPWCGYEHKEYCDLPDSDDAFECHSCGKQFEMYDYTERTFCSFKPRIEVAALGQGVEK